MTPRLRTALRLSPDEVTAVHGLVDEVTTADGHLPLSEHVMLHLPLGGDEDVRHVLVESENTLIGPHTTDSSLVGYAHLDVTDPVAGSSAELVVRPSARRSGIGRTHGRGARAAEPGRPAAAVGPRRAPAARAASRPGSASRAAGCSGRCAGR